MGVVLGRQSPENNDDHEDTSKMTHSQDALDQWQFPRNHSVEQDAESHHGNGKKCSMPSLEYIVSVVEHDETLDDRGSKESYTRNCALPASEAQPADYVRQELLCAWRRELRHPCARVSVGRSNVVSSSVIQWYWPPDVGACCRERQSGCHLHHWSQQILPSKPSRPS